MEREDENMLIQFGKKITARQEEYLLAYIETKSAKGAAVVLGVSKGQAESQLGEVARKKGLKSIRDLLPPGERRIAKQNKASAGELYGLLESQEFRCALSGVALTLQETQLDHIHPVKDGGSHNLDNLQWLDAEVNRAKGTMSNEAFISMCRRVAAWNS